VPSNRPSKEDYVIRAKLITAVDLVDTSPLRANPAELREHAERDGYLYQRGLIAPATVFAARQAVLELCRTCGWVAEGSTLMDGVAAATRAGAYDDMQWIRFLPEALALPEVRALAQATPILNVLQAIYDGPPLAYPGDICRVVSPDTAEFTTPPHQDAWYLRNADTLWTAWLPLGDCPLSLGPLALLTGTHMQGLVPHTSHKGDLQTAAIPLETAWATGDMLAGDVLFLHGLTVHRAFDNKSADRLRLSLNFRFVRGSA
jgi:hypothetical protein